MPTKILIAIPVPSSFLSGVVRATNFLGIETLVFNTRRHSLFEKMIIGVNRNSGLPTQLLNKRLVQVATEFKPDVLLVMKGELIDGETISLIRKLGIKTVNWFPDGLWTLDLILSLVSYYDTFLHFDSLVCDVLRKKGHKNVLYLPYAADILPSDKPPQYRIKKYPVSFIGNYHPERETYFRKIADPNFYLWGGESWETTSLAANYQGVCQYPDVTKILSKSWICLNLHYQAKSNGANLRVYEATAAGTCLLTDYKKDLEKLYRLGEEIITYEDAESLASNLQILNSNHGLALKIGKRGYRRAKGQNTYVHRIKDILKII